MEGSIIFYTYGSTLELNGQQFEAGRLTEDLLNLSPDDYHPLHERMVRIRTLMDIYEYVRKSELWWKLNDEMEQLCQELRRYTVFRLLPDDCYDAFFSVIKTSAIHCPARIPPEKAAEIQAAAKTIYRALDCRVFARVDLFLTPDGEIVFNEVNTIPGFTAHSRYPSMMQGIGISFGELVTRLIELGVAG